MSPAKNDQSNSTPANPPRILVAGENPAKTHELEGSLKARGFKNVRSTTDAREIVPLFDKWKFTILFLDMDMPNVPSPLILAHFSKEIREHTLAIIAQTSYKNLIMAERALVLGAMDVCEIEVSPTEAQARVGSAIQWLKRGSGDASNVIDFNAVRAERLRKSVV